MVSESLATASREKVKAARFSILSNTSLTVLKLAAGLITGSVSVLSEAVHSASDLMASWIAFFSVRHSDLPADDKHPYGHGKVESLSGMAEAFLIFAAAIYIIYEAVQKIIHHTIPQRLDLGIGVMAISVATNYFIARYLFRVSKKTDSLALEADAEHLRTDVYTALGVLIGLALARLTGFYLLDPIVAILVAMMIFHAAWRLTRTAVETLMDTQLPILDVEAIKSILDLEPRVFGYHKLRTRKSGSFRYIDAHILLDDTLSLPQAHDLTEEMEDRIRARFPNTEVTLHTEPYEAENRHLHEHHDAATMRGLVDKKNRPPQA